MSKSLDMLAIEFDSVRRANPGKKIFYPEKIRRQAVELLVLGETLSVVSNKLGVSWQKLKSWQRKLPISKSVISTTDFKPIPTQSQSIPVQSQEKFKVQFTSIKFEIAKQDFPATIAQLILALEDRS